MKLGASVAPTDWTSCFKSVYGRCAKSGARGQIVTVSATGPGQVDGGRRALVVEDEPFISMLIEDMLVDLGFQVVGSAARLDAALKLAREERFDIAVLDVNLAEQQSFPVAHVLRERGIPFVFATGYGTGGIEETFTDAVTLQKPFEPEQLAAAIAAATA